MSSTSDICFLGGDFIAYVGKTKNEMVPIEKSSNELNALLIRLFSAPGSLDIQTESGNVYGVFCDRRNGAISSSQRAILVGTGQKYRINRHGLCEQLITGSITGNETCFEGIERFNKSESILMGDIRVNISRFPTEEYTISTRFLSEKACIDYQLEILREKFRQIKSVAGDRGISMGLSGGYDSRLMLLLALEAGIPIHAYTYISPDHHIESEIAKLIADCANIQLKTISIKSIEQLTNSELQENIEDSIVYYDGRTNETMGSFDDNHTGRKQREMVGQAALNLNGLGGELFRNRERLPPYNFMLEDWFNCYVIGVNGTKAFRSSATRLHFIERTCKKYRELLGMGSMKYVDRHFVRRWYRNVWLPYFAGPRLSAENRVRSSLMPFADGKVSASALAVSPFIGSHGEFEAGLIRRLEARVASLPSSYGRGFARSSIARRIIDLGISFVPLQTRIFRHRVKNSFSRKRDMNIAKWQNRFSLQLAYLKNLNLAVDIDCLMQNRMSRNRVLYMAEFIYRHRENIDANSRRE